MKTQSKSERINRFYNQLSRMGFTFEESNQLRRIQMTLHRWAEQECGDGNEYSSWSIERDEASGKPFRCVYPHSGRSYRLPIADREKGALRRLDAIMRNRMARLIVSKVKGEIDHAENILPYHQTDPRGCSLYLVRESDVRPGESLDSIYSRGFAVCL